MPQANRIDSPTQFDDSPAGQYKLWSIELEAAQEAVKDWHEQGQKVEDRFLDKREDKASTRLNLFTANVQTLRAMLYGKVPSADVVRRFGDASDDTARVAGEIIERVLNCDIERDGDGYKDAVGYSLDDRLLPGLGIARVRYTVETSTQEVPAQTEDREVMTTLGPVVQTVEVAPAYKEEVKTSEDVETDYVHWRDFLWSPARVWGEVRWVAFRVWMTRDDLVARFGEDVGGGVPLNTSAPQSETSQKTERGVDDPWGRAEVWEIWDKTNKRVVWQCPDFHQTLDSQDDPLKLAGFFPCPRPLLANVTTGSLIPTPDFVFAQDQYDEIDTLSARIMSLEQSIRVTGIYDRGNHGVGKLLDPANINKLIPVDNWALLAEKVGATGPVIWFPIAMVAEAIERLEAQRDRLVMQVYQVTGMSDIMRGQAQVSGTTAAEQTIKARFASVRVQAIQDEVSRFASDLLRLRSEIIAARFDDETIMKRSNMAAGKDAQLIGPALQLIRSDLAQFRIEVKPENINLADAAAMKNERLEFMAAVGSFLQNTMPLRVGPMADPAAASMMNEIVGWALASFKGSAQIEGAFDRYSAQAEQRALAPKPPPGPPPQLMVAQAKAGAEMQKIKATTQADLTKIAAETQAEITKQRAQAQFNAQESEAEMRAKAMGEVIKATGGMPGSF